VVEIQKIQEKESLLNYQQIKISLSLSFFAGRAKKGLRTGEFVKLPVN